MQGKTSLIGGKQHVNTQTHAEQSKETHMTAYQCTKTDLQLYQQPLLLMWSRSYPKIVPTSIATAAFSCFEEKHRTARRCFLSPPRKIELPYHKSSHSESWALTTSFEMTTPNASVYRVYTHFTSFTLFVIIFWERFSDRWRFCDCQQAVYNRWKHNHIALRLGSIRGFHHFLSNNNLLTTTTTHACIVMKRLLVRALCCFSHPISPKDRGYGAERLDVWSPLMDFIDTLAALFIQNATESFCSHCGSAMPLNVW